MQLTVFCHSPKQITFGIVNEEDCSKNDGLIVVNFDDEDPIKAYRKGLIADHLHMLIGRDTDWKEIDKIISDIMNIKIHWI